MKLMRSTAVRGISKLALVTTLTASLALTGGGVANAATGSSPYDPPATQTATNTSGATEGTLSFYNAAGTKIYGGPSSTPPAFIRADSDAGRPGDTLATVFAATPVKGSHPSTWGSQQISAADTYPRGSAPFAGSANAVVGSTFSWFDPGGYPADVPNTNTDPAWTDLFQVRIYTSGAGQAPDSARYASATIAVNSTAGTWSQLFPVRVPDATITTLAANPVSPSDAGTLVDLTATVSPDAAGSVEFFDGATSLGSVAVSAGSAVLEDRVFTLGSHSLSAAFTPTDSAAFGSSTGTLTYVSTQAPAAATTTALSVNPTSGPAYEAVTLHADITRTTGGTALPAGAGAVRFYDAGSQIGSVVLTATGAEMTSSTLAPGAHSLTATFVPADATAYQGSTSAAVPASYDPPAGPAPAVATAQVVVPVGALTITTPYNQTNPFDLGSMVLNASGTRFTASASFPNTGDPKIRVTDTRAGELGWNSYVTATDFSNGGAGVINAQNLSFTSVAPGYLSGDALQAGSVTPYDVTSAAGVVYAAGAVGSDGLRGAPARFAAAQPGASVGTVDLAGMLSLKAPASTPAGLYTATITFTIS